MEGQRKDGFIVADVLQAAAETIKRDRMAVSFHNHAVEFQTRGNGVGRPIDILAKAKGLTFHTDVNVATRAGSDVVAFIQRYPGKTDSLLLTDGPADANRHAPAFGKGDTPWKDIFAAAESGHRIDAAGEGQERSGAIQDDPRIGTAKRWVFAGGQAGDIG